MEFLFIIGLMLFVTAIMPWVNHTRLLGMRNDLKKIQEQLQELKISSQLAPKDENKPVKENQQVSPELENRMEQSNKQEDRETLEIDEIIRRQNEAREAILLTTKPVSVPLVSSKDFIETIQDSFEKNIATKLPVWIGAISLIFAAFFLVKYSIELGWMKPAIRVSMGGIFGMALIAVGQFLIKHKGLPNAERLSQGCVGAGLVALYICVYSAVYLYGLIPNITGFSLMTAITTSAVLLSLKHGQPIAVFGLAGGLLTPALIGSDVPNAITMFAYLFILFAGIFSVIIRKEWWLLAIGSIIGVFCWSAFWFVTVFSADDAIILALFSLGISGVVLSITAKRIATNIISDKNKKSIHGLNFIAIAGGVLTILWLSVEINLTFFEWSIFGLFSIALIVLTYIKPNVYERALDVKAIATLILYAYWAKDMPVNDALTVLFGIALIYIGISTYIMRQINDARFWGRFQTFIAISLYLISYFIFKDTQGIAQSFDYFWGIISLILSAGAIYQIFYIQRNYNVFDGIKKSLLASYCFMASAFISIGLAIELPGEHLPLALTAQAAMTAIIFGKTKIEFLKQIVFVLTLVFIALNIENLVLICEKILTNIAGENINMGRFDRETIATLLTTYIAPSLLLALSFSVFAKNNNQDKKLDFLLVGTALFFGAIGSYFLFKNLIGGNYALAMSTQTSFIARSFITIALAIAAYILFKSVNKFKLENLKIFGSIFIALAIFRYVYFDLIIYNPFLDSDQYVGAYPIINGITFVYGVATSLIAFLFYKNTFLTNNIIYKTFGTFSLFVFVSLTIRQLFHGAQLAIGTTSSSELYSYSAAWLITGVFLLIFGVIKENKTARMISLVFMILTILKVFLLDASALEGLYRVFSFLGLGLSLMGLSFFYSKFVFEKKI